MAAFRALGTQRHARTLSALTAACANIYACDSGSVEPLASVDQTVSARISAADFSDAESLARRLWPDTSSGRRAVDVHQRLDS